MKFLHLIGFLSILTFSISSCQKNDAEYVTSLTSKVANAIATRQWNLKEVKSQVSGGTWADVTATYPICLLDDIIKYDKEGSFTVDDYNYKCNSSDPRFKTNGIWSLSADEKILYLTDQNGVTLSRNIVSVDSVTMLLSEVNSTTTTQYVFRH